MQLAPAVLHFLLTLYPVLIYPQFNSPQDMKRGATKPLTLWWYGLSYPQKLIYHPRLTLKERIYWIHKKNCPVTRKCVQSLPDILFTIGWNSILGAFWFSRCVHNNAQLYENNMQNIAISAQHCWHSGLGHITWALRADLWSRRQVLWLMRTDQCTSLHVISRRSYMKIETVLRHTLLRAWVFWTYEALGWTAE